MPDLKKYLLGLSFSFVLLTGCADPARGPNAAPIHFELEVAHLTQQCIRGLENNAQDPIIVDRAGYQPMLFGKFYEINGPGYLYDEARSPSSSLQFYYGGNRRSKESNCTIRMSGLADSLSTNLGSNRERRLLENALDVLRRMGYAIDPRTEGERHYFILTKSRIRIRLTAKAEYHRPFRRTFFFFSREPY